MLGDAAAVIIVGGGPAGTATAIAASAADPSVASSLVILDRATFPRDKPCGGGITRHGVKALVELGLEPFAPFAPVRQLRVRALGRDHNFARPEPFFEVAVRRELDAWLLGQARAAGVTVLEATRVKAVTRRGASIELRTDGGILRAPLVVGADGSSSLVRRGLLPGPERQSRLIEVIMPSEPDDIDDRALFDFTPMRSRVQGYGWSFPAIHDGVVVRNRGIFDSRLHDRDRPTSLVDILLRNLEAPDGIRPRLASHPLRRWSKTRTPAADGLLLVGDALGADGLTGEGISVALRHGILAGRALAATGLDPYRAPQAYARALAQANITALLRHRSRWARRLYGHGGALAFSGALFAAEAIAAQRLD